MIDLHSHILPGIDDGSRSPEMTRGMLAIMEKQGVEKVVATPHFLADYLTPKKFLQLRQEAYERLDCPENIILGAEVAFMDGMSRWEELPQLQIGNSGLILIEMPFNSWSHRAVEEVCGLREQTGLTPVLAHVERYRKRDQLPGYLDELRARGVLFQSNAEAFLSLTQRRWVLEQVKLKNVRFLGSDAHNLTTRAPRLQEAAAVIDKKLGKGVVDALTNYAKKKLQV